jgi:hypothetical protein
MQKGIRGGGELARKCFGVEEELEPLNGLKWFKMVADSCWLIGRGKFLVFGEWVLKEGRLRLRLRLRGEKGGGGAQGTFYPLGP